VLLADSRRRYSEDEHPVCEERNWIFAEKHGKTRGWEEERGEAVDVADRRLIDNGLEGYGVRADRRTTRGPCSSPQRRRMILSQDALYVL